MNTFGQTWVFICDFLFYIAVTTRTRTKHISEYNDLYLCISPCITAGKTPGSCWLISSCFSEISSLNLVLSLFHYDNEPVSFNRKLNLNNVTDLFFFKRRQLAIIHGLSTLKGHHTWTTFYVQLSMGEY